MWLLKLLAVFIQISALLALGHPDCGKLAGKRGGTGGTAHSTGEKASAQTHAWSVAIVIEQDGGSKIHCSGSIIDEKTVLTAAHCFVNPEDPASVDFKKMKVIVGSNKPTDEESLKKRKRLVQKKNIDKFEVHTRFDKQTIAAYYDVAVVTIKGKFRFKETIWPICLPDKAELDQNAYEDIGMVLAAYGPYAEELGGLGEVLTAESFTGQNDKFCSAIYSLQSFEAEYEQVENDLPRKFDDASIFCAKVPGSSSGTCPGDSGGPLFTIKFVPELLDRRAIQRAVVRGSIKPCDGERFPSIFVRLDNYEVLKWIMETVFPDEPPIEDPSKIVVQGPRGPAGPKGGSVSTTTFNETQCARRATSSINSPCLVWETEDDKQTKGPREKAGGGECIYNCEPNDGMFCRVAFEKANFTGKTKGLCFKNQAWCQERCEGYVGGGSPALPPAPDSLDVDMSNIDYDSDESIDNSIDLLTASENLDDQELELKGSLENLVGNCRATKIYTIDYPDGTKTSQKSYEYECFEKDPVWGWVSFSFMCVPGFFFWAFISYSVSKANYLPETSHRCLGYLYFALLVLAMIPLVVLYPLLLIVVKFVSIFHHGVQWQKLNNFMTLFEGQIEGYLQVGLQSYIVCSRADRVPSAPQIIALVTSVIMILLAQAKAWYANQPEISVVADIKRKIVIAVLMLIPNLAVFGSGLIIAVTLFSHKEWGQSYRSLNTMLLGIGILIMICCFCVYWFFWHKWNWDTNSHHCCAKPRLRKIILHYILALSFLGLLLLVIWTTLDVNYHPIKYRAFIVEKTEKFNALAGIVFGVGFFPLTIFLLCLFFLAQPNTKERILTGIPLVILLILGISLIPSLYQLKYIQNLNSSDIANNEEPIISDIANNVVSESPIPGYDNSRINPRPARSCDILK